MVIVGSWLWGGIIIASYQAWRREHPGVSAPLSIHGLVASIIVGISQRRGSRSKWSGW